MWFWQGIRLQPWLWSGVFTSNHDKTCTSFTYVLLLWSMSACIYIRIQLHLIGLWLTSSQTSFCEKDFFFSHAHCVNYLILAKLRLPSGTWVREIMGNAQFSFPLSLSRNYTSFEVAEIIGSKGLYTLSCIHLLLIEFWSHSGPADPCETYNSETWLSVSSLDKDWSVFRFIYPSIADLVIFSTFCMT